MITKSLYEQSKINAKLKIKEYKKLIKEFGGNKNTFEAKKHLLSKNIEFLIEGVDKERIEELKINNLISKQTRVGYLNEPGKSLSYKSNGFFSSLNSPEIIGYRLVEDEATKQGANVIVARNTGIDKEHNSLFGKYNKRTFNIKGVLYKI